MKLLLRTSLPVCVLLLLVAATHAQTPTDKSGVSSTFSGGKRAAVVVVGSAAKGVWATTKFGGKHIVLPVGKTIFVKVAPRVAKFALKQSAKRLLPLAIKLSVL